ncbi:Myrosinase 1 [Frankliniella fusca]|uniref:Myrosinase 1 n=1 Tax=Frankliniella fusca TaxID=407009 RepID=A0AAE1I7E3_9NEOP|nr:Myrosinase 1 [Frankliniella fusca]
MLSSLLSPLYWCGGQDERQVAPSKMTSWWSVLLSALLCAAVGARKLPGLGLGDVESVALPEGFLLGAGTSALQTEGAVLEDGKKESVIDYNIRTAKNKDGKPVFPDPGRYADSYHRYKEDIAAAKELKLQVYRLSVSWARIFPDGDITKPNMKGVEHYKNVLSEIVNAGMQPFVTMYHFDQPLEMIRQNLTWSDRRIVDNFVAYADFLFENFGDKVKLWTTINEPNFYCTTYGVAPVLGLYEPGYADEHKCIHHSVLAHAKVYRLYETKYREKQGGKIGAAALTLWGRPNSTAWDDIHAADRLNVFGLGSIYSPLVYGDYPPEVRERIDRHSREEGLPESKLPSFSEEEKRIIAGTADFLCFNAYFGSRVVDTSYRPRPRIGKFADDQDAEEINYEHGQLKGLFMEPDPTVLWEASKWIWKNYKLPIFITENGWGDERENADPLQDEPRMGYHSEYLRGLLRAHDEEGVQIMGYVIWSLIDTFEYTSGYTRRFGLVHVDYEGGTLKRTLKNSASFFQHIAETRRVPVLTYDYKEDKADSTTTTPGTSAAASASLSIAVLSLALSRIITSQASPRLHC